jgi:hypothetical protein
MFDREKLRDALINKRHEIEKDTRERLNTTDYAVMIQVPYLVLYRAIELGTEPNPKSFGLICDFLGTKIQDYYE